MRLINTVSDSEEAARLIGFLKRKGIEAQSEMSFDPKTGLIEYQIWVRDEDALAEAALLIEEFKRAPGHTDYDAPPVSPLAPPSAPFPQEGGHFHKTFFTTTMLLLCVFLFFFSAVQLNQSKGEEGAPERLTEVQKTLLFDVPPAPQEGPIWQGVYEWVLLKAKGEPTSGVEGPLFSKIRQGEVWRLFTPCLLHGSFLHILFNMIWLWVLGRAIEERIGALKSIVLTVIIGIGANVAQYLMSGPLFLGYSGIVVGLAGFIWSREKKAPWEGYPVHRSTFLFLFFFVLIMGVVQGASFFLQIVSDSTFNPGIANTAHIAGGLIGALLGKYSFFAKTPQRTAS